MTNGHQRGSALPPLRDPPLPQCRLSKHNKTTRRICRPCSPSMRHDHLVPTLTPVPLLLSRRAPRPPYVRSRPRRLVVRADTRSRAGRAGKKRKRRVGLLPDWGSGSRRAGPESGLKGAGQGDDWRSGGPTGLPGPCTMPDTMPGTAWQHPDTGERRPRAAAGIHKRGLRQGDSITSIGRGDPPGTSLRFFHVFFLFFQVGAGFFFASVSVSVCLRSGSLSFCLLVGLFLLAPRVLGESSGVLHTDRQHTYISLCI